MRAIKLIPNALALSYQARRSAARAPSNNSSPALFDLSPAYASIAGPPTRVSLSPPWHGRTCDCSALSGFRGLRFIAGAWTRRGLWHCTGARPHARVLALPPRRMTTRLRPEAPVGLRPSLFVPCQVASGVSKPCRPYTEHPPSSSRPHVCPACAPTLQRTIALADRKRGRRELRRTLSTGPLVE